MVGQNLWKKKKVAGTPGKAYNQTIVLTRIWYGTEDICRGPPLQGVKTVIEAMIGCFLREDGTLDRDRLEQFWKEYVKK